MSDEAKMKYKDEYINIGLVFYNTVVNKGNNLNYL